jgi:hypothetical protein
VTVGFADSRSLIERRYSQNQLVKDARPGSSEYFPQIQINSFVWAALAAQPHLIL